MKIDNLTDKIILASYNEAKSRKHEYFTPENLLYAAMLFDEANEIMNDKDLDFLELDEAYAIRELENLAEKAKEGFQTETGKHDFNLPSIYVHEINNIVKSLEEMEMEILFIQHCPMFQQ